jgi:hypothetical protein
MLFIPVDIPAKYMPLAMYGLFCLFSGLQLSYAVAIGVGYLQSQGHLDRYRPSKQALEDLEAADGSLHQVSQAKGYVTAGAVGGHDEWVPMNATQATWAPSGAGGADAASQDPRGGTVAQPPRDQVGVHRAKCIQTRYLLRVCILLVSVPRDGTQTQQWCAWERCRRRTDGSGLYSGRHL